MQIRYWQHGNEPNRIFQLPFQTILKITTFKNASANVQRRVQHQRGGFAPGEPLRGSFPRRERPRGDGEQRGPQVPPAPPGSSSSANALPGFLLGFLFCFLFFCWFMFLFPRWSISRLNPLSVAKAGFRLPGEPDPSLAEAGAGVLLVEAAGGGSGGDSGEFPPETSPPARGAFSRFPPKQGSCPPPQGPPARDGGAGERGPPPAAGPLGSWPGRRGERGEPPPSSSPAPPGGDRG